MTITLNLEPELIQRLQEKAAQQGKTLEDYLNEVFTREAQFNAASPQVAPASSQLSA